MSLFLFPMSSLSGDCHLLLRKMSTVLHPKYELILCFTLANRMVRSENVLVLMEGSMDSIVLLFVLDLLHHSVNILVLS